MFLIPELHLLEKRRWSQELVRGRTVTLALCLAEGRTVSPHGHLGSVELTEGTCL